MYTDFYQRAFFAALRGSVTNTSRAQASAAVGRAKAIAEEACRTHGLETAKSKRKPGPKPGPKPARPTSERLTKS